MRPAWKRRTASARVLSVAPNVTLVWQGGTPVNEERTPKEVLLTPEGLRRLEQELEELRSVRRPQVASRIKQALEFGDISENAEYDAAKAEQAFIEGRIAALEGILARARVIGEEESLNGETAGIGSRVRIKDLETGEEFDFVLVSPAEANPSDSRLSYESPVGKAILGATVGAIVEVEAPDGRIRYQLLSIRPPGLEELPADADGPTRPAAG